MKQGTEWQAVAIITNYMEQSPSSVAYSSSDGQEIPRLLWNPTIYFNMHKSTPFFPVPSPINSVYAPLSFPEYRFQYYPSTDT